MENVHCAENVAFLVESKCHREAHTAADVYTCMSVPLGRHGQMRTPGFVCDQRASTLLSHLLTCLTAAPVKPAVRMSKRSVHVSGGTGALEAPRDLHAGVGVAVAIAGFRAPHRLRRDGADRALMVDYTQKERKFVREYIATVEDPSPSVSSSIRIRSGNLPAGLFSSRFSLSFSARNSRLRSLKLPDTKKPREATARPGSLRRRRGFGTTRAAVRGWRQR